MGKKKVKQKKCQEQGEDLLASFAVAMKQRLGKEDYEAFVHAGREEPVRGIMLNLQKIQPEEFENISPFPITPVPWAKGGYYVENDDAMARHPYFHAGLYYIQEPSAMLPVAELFKESFMKEERGEPVVFLDVCAAPGGKTIQAFSYEDSPKNSLIITNELSEKRVKAVIRNVERFGIRNVVILNEDANALGHLVPLCTHLLVDAPCSGEGMFRKDPTLLSSYKKRGPAFYADIQKELLDSLFQPSSPLEHGGFGGRAVYSTCTFSTLENEEQIRNLIEKEKKDKNEGMDLLSTTLLMPHKVRGEGHFVALMEGHEPAAGPSAKVQGPEFPPDADPTVNWTLLQQWMEFTENYLVDGTSLFPREYLYSQGDRLYLAPSVPLPMDQFKSLHIIRFGLLLGYEGKKIFEPSQALAHYVDSRHFKYTLDLSSQEYQVMKYLKGESLPIETVMKNAEVKVEAQGKWCQTLGLPQDFSGYLLVTVDGYSLGFARVTNGVFKNLYSKSMRILK